MCEAYTIEEMLDVLAIDASKILEETKDIDPDTSVIEVETTTFRLLLEGYLYMYEKQSGVEDSVKH